MKKTLNNHNHQPLIIIVGGGFGGIELAKKLRNKPVQVLLLEPQCTRGLLRPLFCF